MGVTKEYKDWSLEARIRQVELDIGNREIAEELKLSRQYITDIINGRREKSWPTICRISKRLGIDRPKYSGGG
jgi:plasmid maintenance system antidote protein VapI